MTSLGKVWFHKISRYRACATRSNVGSVLHWGGAAKGKLEAGDGVGVTAGAASLSARPRSAIPVIEASFESACHGRMVAEFTEDCEQCNRHRMGNRDTRCHIGAPSREAKRWASFGMYSLGEPEAKRGVVALHAFGLERRHRA